MGVWTVSSASAILRCTGRIKRGGTLGYAEGTVASDGDEWRQMVMRDDDEWRQMGMMLTANPPPGAEVSLRVWPQRTVFRVTL